MTLETVLRRSILTLAEQDYVRRMATRYGLKLGASRFVAGATVDEAIEVVRQLNRDGILATLDHLGESVEDPAAARQAAEDYLVLLDRIAESGVNSNVSLKLTQMGLKIDPALCRENVRRIVERAGQYQNFVRIDMEDSPVVDITLDIFRELRRDFSNVGTVIQAYLYRAEEDVRQLGEELDANLRLVKGAYNEPPSVAFPEKKDVDENFLNLIKLHLRGGHYTAVATHDEAIIEATKRFAAEEKIPRSLFEFQMLYGIRSNLQKSLADEGYTVRCYVPYGTEWYPYFMRRLAERPANVGFILRNLFNS